MEDKNATPTTQTEQKKVLIKLYKRQQAKIDEAEN